MSEQNTTETCVLFVGNIPYSILDTELQSLFGEKFAVDAAAVVRDERDRSRGFGFVRLANANDVEQAIEAFNGFDISGRSLRVAAARSDSRYIEMVTI